MLAFRGSLCLESQYFLGHCSYLLQDDGESWCARKSSFILFTQSARSGVPMVMSVLWAWLIMSSDVSIDLSDDSSKSGALVVVCFPGPGFVANIVAHHMVESLDLKMVGSIRHPSLPQACIVKNGLSMPTVRIYSGEPVCNHESCDSVLVVVSEVQIPTDLILPLSERFVEWSMSKKAGAMLVLDSYSKTIESGHTIDDNDDSNETVKGAASTERALTSLSNLGIDRMEQGAIGGLMGVFLNESAS